MFKTAVRRPEGRASAASFHAVLLLVLATVASQATTYDCTSFSIPGGTVGASGINKWHIVVGTYRDSSTGLTRGFIRDAAGKISFVDYPGATSTQLFTINNNGITTGSWSTSPAGGPVAGYFTLDLPGNFKTITFPAPYAASNVVIYGINDNGVISGFLNTSQTRSPFILYPDGTLQVVPGQVSIPVIGSINNSLELLEPGTFGVTTALLGSDNTLQFLSWPYPGPPPPAPGYAGGPIAFGLNNPGTVVGDMTLSFNNPFGPPNASFERDPSGVYSDLLCPGIPLGGFGPQAVSDDGVVAGGGTIAVPQPGLAVFSASADSLFFPPQFRLTTSAPMKITVANTGNTRLDIGGIHMLGNNHGGPGPATAFQLSGCVDPATGATSLDPGASCVLSVAVNWNIPGFNIATPINDLLIIDDSSRGSPHTIPVSFQPTGAPPPPCRISSVDPGPPEQVNFTIQDSISGLKSIVLLDSVNATAIIPSFFPGGPQPIVVTATQGSSSAPSKVEFQITNMAGGVSNCGTNFGGPIEWTGIGGVLQGKIAVAGNLDGRLQAFVRGSDNALWTIAQTTPDGVWSEWQSLGGVINGDPAVGVNADGRLEVFALSSDNSLSHIWQTAPDGSWSNWQGLGGILSSNLAVATNVDGRLELCALGTDRALWHIWQTSAGGGWSGWDSLGGAIISNPAVVVNQDGRLEVFGLGADHALRHIAKIAANRGWADWASLGGNLTGDPAPVVNQDGRLEVFATGADSSLWHIWQTSSGSSWSDFDSFGGALTSDPAVAMNADGRLEVFARGADNALWRITQAAPNSGWSEWQSFGGILASGVSAIRNQAGRVEAFAKGIHDGLWSIEQTAPGSWH